MKTIKTIRWESVSGKHWLEAYQHSDGCWMYKGEGQCGCIGVMTEERAREYLDRFILPNVQPDANKKPMREVFI